MWLTGFDVGSLSTLYLAKPMKAHTLMQAIARACDAVRASDESQRRFEVMATNPLTMDYYRRYQEIVADYNREKDRATIEKTFGLLVTLASELDAEQRRATEEGLSARGEELPEALDGLLGAGVVALRRRAPYGPRPGR